MEATQPDLVTCSCNNCDGHLQFERQHAGQRINCPHCGMETLLYVPQSKPPPPPLPQAPQPQTNPNLRTCRDCGNSVSIHAEVCPKCGATFARRKSHGVFFYVFWGVVSLIVTVTIVGMIAGILTVAVPAFLRGRREAQVKMLGTNAAQTSLTLAQNLKLDYIKNHLELYDFTARYFDSVLDGKVPGVDFKIRNTGTQTLVKVEVTVYFKDSFGKVIAEAQYNPVLVTGYGFSDGSPLKPNYIWQMERGKFFAAKNVPSEWKEGAAEAQITDIRLAEEKTQ